MFYFSLSCILKEVVHIKIISIKGLDFKQNLKKSNEKFFISFLIIKKIVETL